MVRVSIPAGSRLVKGKNVPRVCAYRKCGSQLSIPCVNSGVLGTSQLAAK